MTGTEATRPEATGTEATGPEATGPDSPGTTSADLETWVREELGLDSGTSVRISEQPGSDPRCSPVVTQVDIESPPDAPYTFHIERGLGELTRMDLVGALAFGH